MRKIDIKKYITEAFKEATEATGAASAGGYSAPLFSMWSEDDEAKEEYKRMDGEFKEATGSSSIGAYDAPGFEDVNMRGNNPVGRGKQFKKPLYKGGGFVEFNKKCTKYNNSPWCSQGDSKDKPVKVKRKKTKSSPLNEAILNVSKRTGISVDEIKNIIIHKINSNL